MQANIKLNLKIDELSDCAYNVKLYNNFLRSMLCQKEKNLSLKLFLQDSKKIFESI